MIHDTRVKVNQGSTFCGLRKGPAGAEVVCQERPVPLCIVGIQDKFGESGDPELLYRNHGMDMDSIVAKAVALKLRKENK